MAQHAGYGAVATIGAGPIESILSLYIQSLGPMFFAAPDSITVGGSVVRFSGVFEMLPPTVLLTPNPANLVTLKFAFRSRLSAQVIVPGTITIFRKYNVELRGAVSLAPIISIQNQSVLVGINTSTVNFTPLTAVTLSGPSLPPAVKNALESPEFAALVNNFVHSRPNIMLTPPLLKTVIEKTVQGDFKETGVSIFNWFTIRLEASNIVYKVTGGSITIAVDFRNRTKGNFGQLDSVWGTDDVWMETRTPDAVEQQRPAYIVKGHPARSGNLGVLFNMDVLSAEIASVSAQTAHTNVSKNAELRSLSLGYTTFTKPLYPGVRDGYKLSFQATVHPSNINVFGAVYLQPVVAVYEGPTAFLRDPSWSLRIVHSELDTEWWIDVIVFALAALASVALPALFPIFLVTAIAVSDGVLPGLLDDARNSAVRGLEKSLLGLPSPGKNNPLPGLPGGTWGGEINHVAFRPEGLHTTIDISAVSFIKGPKLIAPDGWHAEKKGPMQFSVKLSAPMEKMANNLSVLWEVFRTDTNGLLRSRTRRYLADDVFIAIDRSATVRGVQMDPDTNGILIGLRDPDYYFLTGVKVRCTVTATFGSQAGVIWSDEVTVVIEDDLDRSRNFLEWGPHRVFFANAGTNNETWSHDRTSRIHRTATGARCMMLRQRAEASPRMRPKFRYFDTVPHPWDQLANHRHFLCDFCFFGGPDKNTPFPKEKWF